VTDQIPPANLTKALAWSWHHPDGKYHTIIYGALMDDKKNVYLTCTDGIRKFSTDGEMLWHYFPPPLERGCVLSMSSIMDGRLFASTQKGWVFALDMETGKELWAEKKAKDRSVGLASVESHDGIVVTGVDRSGPPNPGGDSRLLGLDAKTGQTLWSSSLPEHIMLYSTMAVFPGDDSFIVMDTSGSVYKHGLHNGTLLWVSYAVGSIGSFSDGGVVLGPDGTSYTCSQYEGAGKGSDDGVLKMERGALRAYRLSDGKMLWNRTLDYPCMSWPVVAPNGEVIVPSGDSLEKPVADSSGLADYFHTTKEALHDLSLQWGNDELKNFGFPLHYANIKAFDAKTGEPKWTTELPPYGRTSAAGDEEGYPERKKLGIRNSCFPEQFGSPTVSGDGTIYVGRADGALYAVESGTGNFKKAFETGAGFQHPGTIWAPGMMAVPSCDGLFVWKW
jgi:outer membrane protein assembly factor BamB